MVGFFRVFDFFKNAVGTEYEPIHPEISDEEEVSPPSELRNISNSPTDRYNVVYWIFFLQGLAMLLPWNAFITASEFFRVQFTGSPYTANFQNYFSIGYMTSNLVAFAIALNTQKKANIFRRIVISLVVNALMFALIIASTRKVDKFTSSGYFYFIMSMIMISGTTTAYLQNGVFALVSQFLPTHTQAVMSGQGMAGMTVSVTQIFTALATNSPSIKEPTLKDLVHGAYIYFLFTLIIAVAALITYNILINLPLYHYYITIKSSVVGGSGQAEASIDSRSLYGTFLKIKRMAIAVAFIFTVTLSVFPSITASIKSVMRPDQRGMFQQDYLFIPLHFLFFNIGDLIGKNLPGIDYFIVTKQKTLATLSFAHVIFIPLFLASNVDVGQSGIRMLPVLVSNDYVYLFILLMFAISNGYLGALMMMVGPQKVADNEKDLAGSILVFCLVSGLALGSLISFPLRAIICGCNPFYN
ncbi:hypothetical protein G9A89_018567 [Geosiphon pyriformis]|nr:hypothetical protein G9A89_018567 [Geosiphon pyriformis]